MLTKETITYPIVASCAIANATCVRINGKLTQTPTYYFINGSLMAKIFKATTQSRNRKHKSTAKQLADFTGTVTGYDHRAKGIIRTEQGRIAFVNGAMLGETIKVRPSTYTDKVIEGDSLQLINASPERIDAKCEHFGVCGGCQLQYMEDKGQVSAKQQALGSLIQRQMKISQVPWHNAIEGDSWRYRRTARLVTWVNKDKSVSLGFRQAKSKQIVDIDDCPILAESLSKLISPIRAVLTNLNNAKSISHVQLYHLPESDTVILRQTSDIAETDKSALLEFAKNNQVQLLLEHDNKQFEQVYTPSQSENTEFDALYYTYNKYRYQFNPNNFIQINQNVNAKMIDQALEWLDLKETDTVLDLFSGVGNFTLPLADKSELVFAVEGVNDMVKQIKKNAEANNISNVKAYQADLSKLEEKSKPQWLKPIDKLLLDPARDGAHEVVKKIPLLRPTKILYVSCNPATMVRDLKVLQDAEYTLTKIGLLNMFPQTSHVEAMALLELK